nr:MAG TPA: hypothetical protein [Caudoviricetes sp.]
MRKNRNLIPIRGQLIAMSLPSVPRTVWQALLCQVTLTQSGLKVSNAD